MQSLGCNCDNRRAARLMGLGGDSVTASPVMIASPSGATIPQDFLFSFLHYDENNEGQSALKTYLTANPRWLAENFAWDKTAKTWLPTWGGCDDIQCVQLAYTAADVINFIDSLAAQQAYKTRPYQLTRAWLVPAFNKAFPALVDPANPDATLQYAVQIGQLGYYGSNFSSATGFPLTAGNPISGWFQDDFGVVHETAAQHGGWPNRAWATWHFFSPMVNRRWNANNIQSYNRVGNPLPPNTTIFFTPATQNPVIPSPLTTPDPAPAPASVPVPSVVPDAPNPWLTVLPPQNPWLTILAKNAGVSKIPTTPVKIPAKVVKPTPAKSGGFGLATLAVLIFFALARKSEH